MIFKFFRHQNGQIIRQLSYSVKLAAKNVRHCASLDKATLCIDWEVLIFPHVTIIVFLN